jgi:hypothetical protein
VANRFLSDPDPTTAWAKAAVDGKAAVGRAANLGAIVAAGKVEWSVLNG